MNAALLLMSALAVGAEPVVSSTVCTDCVLYSSNGHGRSSLERLRCHLKKQECGRHIHCPHPGVIPGTEHPTFCQRLKDFLCPNRCMPPKHAGHGRRQGCYSCTSTMIYQSPAPLMHKVDKPMLEDVEVIPMPRMLEPIPSAPLNASPYGVQRLPAPSRISQPRSLDPGQHP